MFKGDPSIRGAGEVVNMTVEQQQEWVRCATDIFYFAKKYFTIITLDNGEQLFDPYEYQKKTIKAILEPKKGYPHLICMWPRQQGKTTVMSCVLLHHVLFTERNGVAIMANKGDTAIEIMDRIKTAYEKLPLWLQQGVLDDGWNKKSLKLENKSKIFVSTTSSSSISGKSINFLYIDEFAKIPTGVAEQFITSTFPVISSGKSTKIVITSTPLGMNHFYDFWKGAIDKKNNFFPIKVNWWEHPDRDEKWKKATIKTYNGDVQKFRQEYSCKFIGSISTLVDSDVLEQMETSEPIEDKWSGALQIWETPQEHVQYVLGVDTAKGVGRDFSVIQVLKVIDDRNIEQVATYSNNHISSYDYAAVCLSVAEYYNNAYMMVENNGEDGGTVLTTLWYDFEYENICNVEKKGLGIRSTAKSKKLANILLKEYVDKSWLKINNRRSIYELSRYVEVRPDVFKAETESAHDDQVTSLLWGLWFLKTPFYEGNVTERRIDAKYLLGDSKADDTPLMFIDDGVRDGSGFGLFDEGSFF